MARFEFVTKTCERTNEPTNDRAGERKTNGRKDEER